MGCVGMRTKAMRMTLSALAASWLLLLCPGLRAADAAPMHKCAAVRSGPAYSQFCRHWRHRLLRRLATILRRRKPRQKFETKVVQLTGLRQYLTPGLLDPELQHIITFPKDGSPVDIGLPHGGKDKSGKDYPALLGRLTAGAVWIDLNGDGKPNGGESPRCQ